MWRFCRSNTTKPCQGVNNYTPEAYAKPHVRANFACAIKQLRNRNSSGKHLNSLTFHKLLRHVKFELF